MGKKIEENKIKKRNSLLHTAFELFTDKGVGNTSISDIVSKAGVAKGTFYLYFKDKIDIKNKLIAHKSSILFEKALEELDKTNLTQFDDKVVFVIDNIVNQLAENHALLLFISKNLSWGVFKNALTSESDKGEINFREVYERIVSEEGDHIKDPEIMLYMIIELVSSASYSSILTNEPVPIEKLKPYMYSSVRGIVKQHMTDN